MVKQAVFRFFQCNQSLKPEQIKGDIPPIRQLYQRTFHIAWPAVVESVLLSMSALVDTMMVGTMGTSAIAAVGITVQPSFLILALIISFNLGVTAVISRRKGANDYEGANQCLKMCLLFSASAILILSFLGSVFADPLLRFAGAGEDIIDPAISYFRIIMISHIFYGISLTINGAQRGVGNTKISMRTSLTANGINIAFNFFLINGLWIFPQLGVQGAAIATAVGSFIGLILSLLSIWSKKGFLSLRCGIPFQIDIPTMKSILGITSSAAVEQGSLRFGFLMYAKIVSGLGTTAFATHQICSTILSLSFGFADGFQIPSSALVGQNLGAKRPDLAKLYVSVNQRLGICVSALLCLIFLFGRYSIIGLFTDDAKIITQGAGIMIILACTVPIQISQVITAGSLRGAGDTRYTAIVALVSIAVFRPLFSWLLCYPVGMGLLGAWITVIIDQFLRLFLLLIRFRSGKWSHVVV